MNASEQKLKEKLLMDLISKMDDGIGDSIKPKKVMSVEVSGDKAHMPDALEKAKELIASKSDPMAAAPAEEEDSDEDRLRALLGAAGEDEEEDEDKKHF